MEYQYEPHQGTHVSETFFPALKYCHELWESHYDETMNAFLDGEGDILPTSLLKDDTQRECSSNQPPNGLPKESSPAPSVKLEPVHSPDSCSAEDEESQECADCTHQYVPIPRAPTPIPQVLVFHK